MITSKGNNMKYIKYNNKELYPSKVVCVGRNFIAHIKELNNEIPEEMVIFIKPNSSISDSVKLPSYGECHYEGEVSFLVQDGKYVAISFGLDLTLRDIQSKLKSKGLPWERAKAFDNSAVFSKFVSIDNFDNLSLELSINDTIVQSVNIDEMIYSPKYIQEEISKYFSLEDNDIVMSGTPKGVGTFAKGDKMVGKISQNGKIVIEKEWIVE
jgi:2-keto-4-pentenoate hydratase/2-oxohepta-3-ene-1,7-dioic acid hydratase in catechol pathway